MLQLAESGVEPYSEVEGEKVVKIPGVGTAKEDEIKMDLEKANRTAPTGDSQYRARVDRPKLEQWK